MEEVGGSLSLGVAVQKKSRAREKIIATGYDVEAFIINMISALSTHRIGQFLVPLQPEYS